MIINDIFTQQFFCFGPIINRKQFSDSFYYVFELHSHLVYLSTLHIEVVDPVFVLDLEAIHTLLPMLIVQKQMTSFKLSDHKLLHRHEVYHVHLRLYAVQDHYAKLV